MSLMGAPQSASHPLLLSEAASAATYAHHLECPRCHHQSKSRARFAKHVESCSNRAAVSSATVGAALGESVMGVSEVAPVAKDAESYHLGLTSNCSSITGEPLILTSSTPLSSPAAPYPPAEGRELSRFISTQLEGMRGEAPSNSVIAGGNVSNGPSHFSYAIPEANGDCRGNLNHSSPAAITLASPSGPTEEVFMDLSALGSAAAGTASSGVMASPCTPRHTSTSRASSTYMASLRAFSGGVNGGERRFTHERSASGNIPAPIWASGFATPTSRRESASLHRPLARQDSFRLRSDGTWTQFTPSNSDEDREDNAHSQRDRFALEYSSRSVDGAPKVANSNPQDGGDHSFGQGVVRLVSPRDSNTSSGKPAVGRQSTGKEGENAGGSPTVVDGQGRGRVSSTLQSSSQLGDGGQHIPRLFQGSIGDLFAPESKGSPFAEGWHAFCGGSSSGRRRHSTQDSASPCSFSRLSSSASPIFAHPMVSSSPLHSCITPTVPTTPEGSINKLGGLNTSVNGGDGADKRTPRLGDRGGTLTPRAISFQRGHVVGSGGFGTVYQAVLSDGSLAAVKELKLGQTNLKAIDREVRAMSSIPLHPHCVRYLGSRYSAHHYYIIMEYISGGSISSLRKSVGRFRESVFQRYAHMVLLGLAHLHRNGIVHRDIKGANVLLDESGCAKIADFGCSRDLNQATTTAGGGGTPLWMAPEVCRGEPATEKSDVWSFGCLCLEMTNDTGVPWSFPPGMTLQGVAYALAQAAQSPPIPKDLSPEAQIFLQRCLCVDPHERATVAELLTHPFFDLDLMEDSEDSEMSSSGDSSAPQSAVKRGDRPVGGTGVLETALPLPPRSTSKGCVAVNRTGASGDSNVPGSPAVRTFPALSLSPRDTQDGGFVSNSRGASDAAASSSTSKSKSPSGPQLDYYTCTSNLGFKLQAVKEDEETGKIPNLDGDACGSCDTLSDALDEPPPAVPETAIPASRRRLGTDQRAAEVKEEYLQTFAEIVTQAREAYTDEERRMTKRRQDWNVMHSSSDDDSSGSATIRCRSHGSKEDSYAEVSGGTHHDDADPDTSFSSHNSSSAEGSFRRRARLVGGPDHHSLGETWCGQTVPADSSKRSSPSSRQVQIATAPSPPSLVPRTRLRGRTFGSSQQAPGPASRKQALLGSAAPAPFSLNEEAEARGADCTETPSGGCSAHPKHRAPAGIETFAQRAGAPPSLLAAHTSPPSSFIEQHGPARGSPRGAPSSAKQPHPSPVLPEPLGKETLGKETPREKHGSLSATAFRRSSSHGAFASAADAMTLSPREPGGPAGVGAALRESTDSNSATPHSSVAAGTPLPPSSLTNVNRYTLGSSALSDRSTLLESSAQLAASGPLRTSSPLRSTATTQRSEYKDFVDCPFEWYTAGSGRLESGTSKLKEKKSRTRAKDSSVVQRELQEMLDWGTTSGLCSPLDSSAPHLQKGGGRSSSMTTNAAYEREKHPHMRFHGHSRSEDVRSARTLPTVGSTQRSGSMSVAEVVDADCPEKRKHRKMGLFRRLTSR